MYGLISKLIWYWYARKSPTIAASRSKEVKNMKARMQKLANPIPHDVWNTMPDMLKRIVKSGIKNGAVISYNPSDGKTGLLSLFGDTVSVYYGPLMSRVYNVKTGICVAMS